MLYSGTELAIQKALYSPCSAITLLSFKDIQDNNYHAKIFEENEAEFLCITSYEYDHKRILEKNERLLNGLHITTIQSIKNHYLAGPASRIALEIFGMIACDTLGGL